MRFTARRFVKLTIFFVFVFILMTLFWIQTLLPDEKLLKYQQTTCKDSVSVYYPASSSIAVFQRPYFKLAFQEHFVNISWKPPVHNDYWTQTKCVADLQLLLIVMSPANEFSQRSTVRNTWASKVALKQLRIWRHVQVLFVVGRQPGVLQKQLQIEQSVHGDLLAVPVHESYRNLSFKVLATLHWICKHCPQVPTVIKLDQDTLPLLSSLETTMMTSQTTCPPPQSYVFGHRYQRARVLRTGRWAVPLELYPLEAFPRYMAGSLYVLHQSVCPIVEAARLFPILPVEDALITGILSYAAGLWHRVDKEERFRGLAHHEPLSESVCSFFGKRAPLAVTDLTSTSLIRLWNKLSTGLADRKHLIRECGDN